MKTTSAPQMPTLVRQPNGSAILSGGKPGNCGGGRPPEAFKALCRMLVTREETLAAVRRILGDPDHPAFVGALKWASEHGYGKPHQTVSQETAGELRIRVIRVESPPLSASPPVAALPPSTTEGQLPVMSLNSSGPDDPVDDVASGVGSDTSDREAGLSPARPRGLIAPQRGI